MLKILIFFKFQDKETGPADYVYADFFEEEKSKKKKNKRKLQEDGAIDKDVKKSKKYTFVKLLGAQQFS